MSRKIENMETFIFLHGKVTPKALMDEFDLSESTVRRYLSELMEKGSIIKAYGFVEPRKKDRLLGFRARENHEAEKKKQISFLAFQCIENGDTLFFDSGTTHMYLAEMLKEKKDLNIVTNNVMLALKLTEISFEGEVLLIPGNLNPHTLSLTGEAAHSFLDDFTFDKGFFTASGCSITEGYTNRTLPERDLKAFLRKRTKKAYMLLDDTKFGLSFPFSFGKLKDYDVVITNSRPDDVYIKAYEKTGSVLVWA